MNEQLYKDDNHTISKLMPLIRRVVTAVMCEIYQTFLCFRKNKKVVLRTLQRQTSPQLIMNNIFNRNHFLRRNIIKNRVLYNSVNIILILMTILVPFNKQDYSEFFCLFRNVIQTQDKIESVHNAMSRGF